MVLDMVAMRRHRFVVAISLVLLAASCGGGTTVEATPSPCATVTPGPDGSPTPTPTPCPAIAGASGESWEGTATIASSAVYPEGSATCEDGWELEFTFVATAEGTIDGQGTAEQTSGPTCPFPIGPSLTHYEYQVLGAETAGGFSIRFALGTFGPAGGAEYAGFVSMFGFPAPPSGGPPVSVAVSGTSGTGPGMWRFESGNPPATYSANGTINIECLTCA